MGIYYYHYFPSYELGSKSNATLFQEDDETVFKQNYKQEHLSNLSSDQKFAILML